MLAFFFWKGTIVIAGACIPFVFSWDEMTMVSSARYFSTEGSPKNLQKRVKRTMWRIKWKKSKTVLQRSLSLHLISMASTRSISRSRLRHVQEVSMYWHSLQPTHLLNVEPPIIIIMNALAAIMFCHFHQSLSTNKEYCMHRISLSLTNIKLLIKS